MPTVTSARFGFRPLTAVGLFSVVLTFLAPALPLSAVEPSAPTEASKSFSIPAGPAETTLKTFAEQSGRSVMFATDKVKGITTNAVSGAIPVPDALDRLLAGTRLSAVPEKQTGGFAIRREATVEIAEKNAPSRPASDRAASRARNGALGGETPLALDTYTVTGSRIRAIEEEKLNPVITFSRQEIDRTGAATMRDLLSTLPQAAVSYDESSSSTFLGSATVQLRGLNLGSTLILLNGRRLSVSAAQFSRNYIDLNSIPMAAIERVEVLPDSATAIYGSDALAGVVNIILKKHADRLALELRYGNTFDRDAAEKAATVTAGFSRGKFSGMLLVARFERNELSRVDREFSNTNDFRPFGGTDMRNTASSPGNIYALPGTGNLPGLTRTFAAVPAGTDGKNLTIADFIPTAGLLNRDSIFSYGSILPDAERSTALATARYAFSEHTILSAQVLWNRSDQYQGIIPAVLTGGSAGNFRVPANNPFNPFGVAVGVDFNFFEAGVRVNDARSDYGNLQTQLEGRVGEHEWRVGVTADRDEARNANLGNINATLVRNFLNSTDRAVALNVFGDRSGNNPETLRQIMPVTIDRYWTWGRSADLSVAGPTLALPGGRMEYAVGGEAREEKLRVRSTSTTLDARRETQAAYLELLAPIYAGVRSSLKATVAGRYDRYSDAGDSTNYKLGLLWRPHRDTLFRVSYGTAFKIPSLSNLHGAVTIRESVVVPDPARGNTSTLVTTRSGSNPDLLPEDAVSFVAGFAWEPEFVRGFHLGANVFRVRQTNQISGTVNSTLLLTNAQLFPDRIVRAAPTASDVANGWPGALQLLDISALNFGRVNVEGIDLDASFQHRLAGGQLNYDARATYTNSYDVLLTPGDVSRNRLGLVATSSQAPVRWKGTISLNWTRSPWELGARVHYLSAYTDYDGIRELGPITTVDITAGCDLGRLFARNSLLADTRLRVGLINALDRTGEFSNNSSGYDSQHADMRGRFFYINLSKRF